MKPLSTCLFLMPFAALSSCGVSNPANGPMAADTTTAIEEQFDVVEEYPFSPIESSIEVEKPDPLACQDETEPFSEKVWTRGGVGQNRQATVVVCNGPMNASTLFETEKEFGGFSLKVQGCVGEGWSLKVGDSHRTETAEAWDEFAAEYLEALPLIQQQCPEYSGELVPTADWIKPAFDHVVSTMMKQREINVDLY